MTKTVEFSLDNINRYLPTGYLPISIILHMDSRQNLKEGTTFDVMRVIGPMHINNYDRNMEATQVNLEI